MVKKIYQCQYCGTKKTILGANIPLKTKCPKRTTGSKLHVWVKVQ